MLRVFNQPFSWKENRLDIPFWYEIFCGWSTVSMGLFILQRIQYPLCLSLMWAVDQHAPACVAWKLLMASSASLRNSTMSCCGNTAQLSQSVVMPWGLALQAKSRWLPQLFQSVVIWRCSLPAKQDRQTESAMIAQQDYTLFCHCFCSHQTSNFIAAKSIQSDKRIKIANVMQLVTHSPSLHSKAPMRTFIRTVAVKILWLTCPFPVWPSGVHNNRACSSEWRFQMVTIESSNHLASFWFEGPMVSTKKFRTISRFLNGWMIIPANPLPQPLCLGSEDRLGTGIRARRLCLHWIAARQHI